MAFKVEVLEELQLCPVNHSGVLRATPDRHVIKGKRLQGAALDSLQSASQELIMGTMRTAEISVYLGTSDLTSRAHYTINPDLSTVFKLQTR